MIPIDPPRLLNLGCGTRCHSAWINIDTAAAGPGILIHDITHGLTISAGSCAAVYHPHLIGHLRRSEVPPFLTECHRVLRSGGIIRVATPDLERIGSSYLQSLHTALSGSAAEHEWMMLEMYDEAVREETGGAMAPFLRQRELTNADFVFGRISDEARLIREAAPPRRPSLVARARRSYWLARRMVAAALLGPKGADAVRIGLFRLSGDVYHWMYDRYPLAALLQAEAFLPLGRLALARATSPTGISVRSIVPPTAKSTSRIRSSWRRQSPDSDRHLSPS
jgi:hypothetical protein